MRKNLILVTFILACFITSFGQYPGAGLMGNRAGKGGQNMNIGHFYGKIVDAKTNKGIAGIAIQLRGNKFDTVSKQMKEAVLKTVITAPNGDFSLESLPIFGNFKLKISAIGYKAIEKQISFGIKFPQGGLNAAGGGMQEGQGNMQQMLGQADKDLGNIKMEADATDLGNVTVSASSKPQFELGIDRKVFNVDKNLVSTGQTATEIMKSIPSLDVDIDGNVTLRNATPTIFVDGRPTTLTLDQIPSDIIDKVEIITNPSAKFDASGGNAGILNIVLKKNRKNGYNGNVRLGIDSRYKVNGGADFSYRQNKLNFFGSANLMGRKSISNAITNTTYFGTPNTNVNSNSDATNNGTIKFLRAGFDYFVDNRNTLSLTGNYGKGKFENSQDQTIDTTQSKLISTTGRNTYGSTEFENFGSQLSFKHNFAKNGHDISADANYNSSTTSSLSNINSLVNNTTTGVQPLYQQQTNGSGYNHFLTLQSDYENPISDDTKFEAGVRAAIRDFRTDNFQYLEDNITSHAFVLNSKASSRYKFNDQVYAAYTTYSFKHKKFSYQLGLRAESSNYTGQIYKLNGQDSLAPFKVSYPLSFFPSAFITYKVCLLYTSDAADE